MILQLLAHLYQNFRDGRSSSSSRREQIFVFSANHFLWQQGRVVNTGPNNVLCRRTFSSLYLSILSSKWCIGRGAWFQRFVFLALLLLLDHQFAASRKAQVDGKSVPPLPTLIFFFFFFRLPKLHRRLRTSD